jgi:hypothetical protein
MRDEKPSPSEWLPMEQSKREVFRGISAHDSEALEFIGNQ